MGTQAARLSDSAHTGMLVLAVQFRVEGWTTITDMLGVYPQVAQRYYACRQAQMTPASLANLNKVRCIMPKPPARRSAPPAWCPRRDEHAFGPGRGIGMQSSKKRACLSLPAGEIGPRPIAELRRRPRLRAGTTPLRAGPVARKATSARKHIVSRLTTPGSMNSNPSEAMAKRAVLAPVYLRLDEEARCRFTLPRPRALDPAWNLEVLALWSYSTSSLYSRLSAAEQVWSSCPENFVSAGPTDTPTPSHGHSDSERGGRRRTRRAIWPARICLPASLLTMKDWSWLRDIPQRRRPARRNDVCISSRGHALNTVAYVWYRTDPARRRPPECERAAKRLAGEKVGGPGTIVASDCSPRPLAGHVRRSAMLCGEKGRRADQ